jgi:phosphoserine phosphatase
MAWYRLLTHETNVAPFLPLCGSPKTPHQGSPFALFEWEAAAISPDILNEIQELNYKRQTCIYWEVRPYQAIFFDMDSTVIGQESIVELARHAGKSDEVHAITEQAMAGQLDFNDALRQRVATLKGQPVSIYDDVKEVLTINPGMVNFAEQAKEHHCELYLISGGFHELAESIANRLAFDGFKANILDRDGDQLTGRVDGDIVNGETKYEFVQKVCQEKGFQARDIVAIGDGANDLKMLSYAGLAIGYHPKDVLIPHINGAIYDSFAILDVLFMGANTDVNHT